MSRAARPGTLGVDERGLLGKLALIVLVVVLLVVVVAVDVGSIVLANVRTADIAQDAASAGAERYAATGRRKQAVRAALSKIADRDEDARLSSLELTPSGAITVVVRDRAPTVLLGRIGLLDELTAVSASATRSATGG